MPGDVTIAKSPLSTDTCYLGFFSVSPLGVGTSSLLMQEWFTLSAYSQLLPLLMKEEPHSHKAKAFLDMTMSHIHRIVPLELGSLKPRDKSIHVSLGPPTHSEKQTKSLILWLTTLQGVGGRRGAAMWIFAKINKSKTGPWMLHRVSVGFAYPAPTATSSGNWHVDFPLGKPALLYWMQSWWVCQSRLQLSLGPGLGHMTQDQSVTPFLLGIWFLNQQCHPTKVAH